MCVCGVGNHGVGNTRQKCTGMGRVGVVVGVGRFAAGGRWGKTMGWGRAGRVRGCVWGWWGGAIWFTHTPWEGAGKKAAAAVQQCSVCGVAGSKGEAGVVCGKKVLGNAKNVAGVNPGGGGAWAGGWWGTQVR